MRKQRTLVDRHDGNGLPRELRNWKEAVDAANLAYTMLDIIDSEDAAHLPQWSIEQRNELRRLAADAYSVFDRVNALGTALLALYDEDNCTWIRAGAEDAAQAEGVPAWGYNTVPSDDPAQYVQGSESIQDAQTGTGE